MTFSVRIPKPRIESLSDLIFGLALSIGSLSLLSRPAVNPSDVVADIFGFGFSFFILISVWLRYTAMVSVWPRERFETGRMMWLNILLLFFVSIEPYLLSLISFGPAGANRVMLAFTSQIYALDLTGLTGILGLFAQMLTKKEEGIEPELIGGYTLLRNTQFVSAGLFGLSALPIFWSWMIQGTPLRFYLWYAILASTWVSRGLQHLLFLSRKAKNMLEIGGPRSLLTSPRIWHDELLGRLRACPQCAPGPLEKVCVSQYSWCEHPKLNRQFSRFLCVCAHH